MEDFSSTVEHLELPRQHVHFDRNRKRAKPCKKGRESLICFCSHFQFQERVLFAPFWSSKCSNRPCSGFLALQGSLKCHGIAVKTTTMAVVQLPKVPRESIDDNPTRWYTRSSLPALDLEKCLLCDSKKKTKRCLSQEALTRCTLESSPTFLLSTARIWVLGQGSLLPLSQGGAFTLASISYLAILVKYILAKKKLIMLEYGKDDVCSWRSTSWQTFMRRNVPCLFLRTESTPAPSPWTPLPLPTRRMPKVLLIIQRLSLMTATRHGFQMSYQNLNDRGVDHRCLLYYESIKRHCAICMASYCEMKYRKKLSEGTVWRARVTWSKGTLTWDWSFTDLTSVQNRSMCSAVKYSQGQLLRDVWGWTRHKKEKKRKSWRWNGVPDELSRSGELEETQHVFNAALILRHAIQSLQPITLFPAEPTDLSEEKIDAHVPSELYNFLSWIMTGKVQDMAPCLNKRVELDNCFCSCFFLDVLFNFLSFIWVTEFSYSCWYVVHIAVMCKTYLYQKWNMDFLFFSISKPKVYLPIPCFFFRFMFHLICICKPAVFLK